MKDFKNKLLLAPMAGVTDYAFREICVRCGADYCFTEMVNAKGLLHDSKKTEELLFSTLNNDIEAVQLFGHDASDFKAVCKLKSISTYKHLDINMGCPAPKIVKNGDGSALMKNPDLSSTIISTCKENFDGIVSVKFRKGFSANNQNYKEFAQMCEKAGADIITIHGRTRDEMYSGTVDYDAIKSVKDAVSIPVIGSGDITNEQTLNQMKETGVDGFMIGRGSLGNPWIFENLKGSGDLACTKDWKKVQKTAHEHISILKLHFSERYILATMKKHLLWYLKGATGVQMEKLKLATADSLKEMLDTFDKIIGDLVL